VDLLRDRSFVVNVEVFEGADAMKDSLGLPSGGWLKMLLTMNCLSTTPLSTTSISTAHPGAILPPRFFADTGFWIAMFRHCDQYHREARGGRTILIGPEVFGYHRSRLLGMDE
jgi:hypothetical protein